MRSFMVMAIFFGLLPFVIKRGWIGVMLWTWISVMNPHRLAAGFASNLPFALLSGGVTLLALFTTRGPVQLPKRAPVICLFLFMLWETVTTTQAFHSADSYVFLDRALKIQAMTLVAAALLHEERHIRIFVWVNAMSVGFFGLKGGIHTAATGGSSRVMGPGGFLAENNEIGLAMVIVVPLIFYLMATTPHRWVRRFMMVTLLLTVLAILGTQSRGAFVSISIMGAVMWWRAPGKRLVTGVAVLVIAGSLTAFMPDSWTNRMKTVQSYEQDGSAMGRINAWETAINIANNRPFGAGFSAYSQEIFSRYAPLDKTDRAADPSVARASHSIWFQTLGEHGWLGLSIFISIWIFTFRETFALRRLTKGKPHLAHAFQLATMCQIALLGYCVGGSFLSLAYMDLPYNLMVTLLVLRRWVEQHMEPPRDAKEEKLPPGAVRRVVPAAGLGLAR
jgi:probable O-glycosylation ligase (exosortase A-associated)